MNSEPARQLTIVADIVRQFGLNALNPVVRACEVLSGDNPSLDVAVLGQFKSGKSSLLNAVLGEPVFPVGVVPVTSVVTRATAGPSRTVQVTRQSGDMEEVALARLAEFVTEAGNPGNRQQVAVVDVFTPVMRAWPGIRLVDTPGLGSVFTHNTDATRTWMPNVAVALVAVSADRPLSDEDRRLVTEALQTAPRVVVVLTKVDLLTEAELAEVSDFLGRALAEHFATRIPLLPFSCRVDPERWLRQLRETVLLPIAGDVAGERRAAVNLKVANLVHACRGYLMVGLQATTQADMDRERLRSAVLDESVSAAVIGDELQLAAQRVCAGTRPAFQQKFVASQAEVTQQVIDALAVAVPVWPGNLAQQTERYEAWMAQRLTAELAPLSQNAAPEAAALLAEAEGRFRRVVEAFRDRLSHNIREGTGVAVSRTAWEVKRPHLAVVPVTVGRAFMTNWELLSWMLPMWLVGGLFRRHVLGRVPWEVEKNLIRLTGDWAEAVNAAVTDLRTQAVAWVDAELVTLDRLLRGQPSEAVKFREALRLLDEAAMPPTE